VRSADDLPVDPEVLRRGSETVLRVWKARRAGHERCPKTVHLQEALFYIVRQMQDLPGRRVILAVSDGEDDVAKPSWGQVSEAAQNAGTAIFAIAPLGVQAQQFAGVRLSGPQRANLLNLACELSGGTLVMSTSRDLPGTLRDFTSMVRDRYIVDFPRPANSTPGRHSLEVRIDKSGAFIRPAGISVPIADPAVLADPTTVPSDPNLTPVQGKRTEVPH
jgi:hypothetical protein